MATGTEIKASVRRKILQEVRRLMQQLIALNESVYQQGIAMAKTDLGSTDTKEAIDALLLTAGLADTTTMDGTLVKISDKIVGLIYDVASADGDAAVKIDVDGTDYALSNSHLKES